MTKACAFYFWVVDGIKAIFNYFCLFCVSPFSHRSPGIKVVEDGNVSFCFSFVDVIKLFICESLYINVDVVKFDLKLE